MTDSQNTQASSNVQPAEQPEFKVFKPPQGGGTVLHALPDSYFTPTAADLRAAQASLSARTRALVDAPLQTRAVREANEQTMKARWPHTTIRVKFPDRTQLEKVFSSTDKIRSVYAFVRPLLRDDIKPIKFILYQSPPKRDLKVSDPKVRDLSLADLQLAPASVLLLRFEDESLNASTVPAPLLPSVLEKAIDLPVPPQSDETPPDSSAASSTSSNSISQTVEKKIPKWLRMGLKK